MDMLKLLDNNGINIKIIKNKFKKISLTQPIICIETLSVKERIVLV
jgi:hypothetical protein